MNDLSNVRVLDLFCGAGGLSIGFNSNGFSVTGSDHSQYAKIAYEANKIGKFILRDLLTEEVEGKFDIIIGGPPCRPWSSVNTKRRGRRHKDYILVSRYFEMINKKRPKYFLLENVPQLLKDKVLQDHIEKLIKKGYSIKPQIVKYSDYGAPISRRRLIVFGTRIGIADDFFKNLSYKKEKSQTVEDAIGYLKDKKRGEIINHEWPDFHTIDKYKNKYETGKFGWYVLKWDKPAPSFGNIMKTYILYPGAFNGGPKRVISVKEALRIIGYDDYYYFPGNIGISFEYQMIADSVSPIFSTVAAKVIKDMINSSKWFELIS